MLKIAMSNCRQQYIREAFGATVCATVENGNISSDSELRFSNSESDINIDQTPDAPESEVSADSQSWSPSWTGPRVAHLPL